MGRVTLLGSTAERGYGSDHQRLRKFWEPKADAGQVACTRCGKLIAPKGARCPRCKKASCRWDLGHSDKDRSQYTGPEHTCCNRATASHRAGRRQTKTPATRGLSRDW
jgi:tRNA(Ile2) C34 agmatinyltransferase TiaS